MSPHNARFSSAIVKLTSFCNLNCTYCYMFNLEDQTFRSVPRCMPLETALAFLSRLEDYMESAALSDFSLALHGGEPTLWPLDHFRAFLAQVEEIAARGRRIHCSIQTNGYRRLHPELLQLFADHRVSIGISLDGPAWLNDQFRVDHRGKGSYERIMQTVEQILESPAREQFFGFLCVAQPEIAPQNFLEWVDGLPVRRIDVLWPLAYHADAPPWEAGHEEDYQKAPRYGQWFAELFERWLERDDPSLSLRSFRELLRLRLHGPDKVRVSDFFLNRSFGMFVVNTDGGLELHDYLRVAGDGLTRTPYCVREHSLEELEDDSRFRRLLYLSEELPEACRGCGHVEICGGGFLSGRASAETLISEKRSVLCHDELYYFSAVDALIARAQEERACAASA